MFRLIMIASLCLGLVGCGGGSGDSKSDAPEWYQITALANEGGTVRLGSTPVQKGYATTASIAPDNHYQIDSVTGCGGKLENNTYQTGSILLDCTIKAVFSPKIYTVTVANTMGGSPNVFNATAAYNTFAKFTLTPDPGYHLVSVSSDCGGTLSVAVFTTGAISEDCTIRPLFELDSVTGQTKTYLVTVVSAVGGNSTPSTLTVTKNDYAKFDLLADEGYHISSVTSSCGGSLVLIRFTTGRVNTDCSIEPHFELNGGIVLNPSVDPTEVATISGTVAQGAAVKSTLVSARCADNSGFIGNIITDAQGYFSGQVLKSSLPCALKVVAPNGTYYSLATDTGTANVTPLTTLILTYASAQTGATWYASSNWQSVIYNLAAAQSGFSSGLTGAGYTLPSGDFLPFSTPFVVGDKWDKLLDQLQAAISSSGGLDTLSNLIKTGDLTALPAPK
jgi:hypothetical protein